ncbi:TIGR01620 family protein [Aurantimonas sp. Leaf443]|uniref:YcjF family protein n=1 Tax=Aurantimonas sp. Leaf443 TaxID=1736378 RepID=UPI0006F1F3E9|nr:TIGR01620 family protein [Aurantimonas sp. Leaf443]KQT86235.1 hypothetical protein ASG48_06615 [Aurantimonas sp. Leaf443]
MDRPSRTPGAYRLPGQTPPRGPDATPVREAQRPPRAIEDLSLVTIEADEAIEAEALEALEPEPALARRRGFSFGKLFVGALGALLSLGIGLAVDDLVRDLFARNEWLGWTALGLSLLLLAGALGVVARETVALMRLSAIEAERRDALAAYDTNDASAARRVVAKLVSFLSAKPETGLGRARMAELDEEVIDGADLVALAERELLTPLDLKARALVLASSKRVSVVTAVSPKALVDVVFVLFETVRLIRRMAELYGARPGALGLVRLTRDVLSHLAVTGTISIGDSLVQQVVGHGIASKLSARLGEGVVNGLLTARVGLAAMDLCRPIPFLRSRRPTIGDFLADLSAIARISDARRAR